MFLPTVIRLLHAQYIGRDAYIIFNITNIENAVFQLTGG